VSWSETQLNNLRTALAVVEQRGLDNTTAVQVIAGILTECSALNYSNPLYPNTIPLGDGLPPRELSPSTKESCGVFQQRPHSPQWWGPPGLSVNAQAAFFMSVANATGLFLDRLVNVPRTNQPWREIQVVQGSEYDGKGLPYAANYQGNWAAAGQLLDQLRGASAGPDDWLTPALAAGIVTAIAAACVRISGS
jgi:hypothetical protein